MSCDDFRESLVNAVGACLLLHPLESWLYAFICSPFGFVSIDCGAKSNYTDTNSLEWTADDTFEVAATAGVAGSVTPPTTTDPPPQFSTIRYFPGDQSKYCYVFTGNEHGVVQGSAYLLRASFWAGTSLPYATQARDSVNFKLLLNADQWYDVLIVLPQSNGATVREIYVVALQETIDVCLAGKSIGMDIPFISSLALRPLDSNMTAVKLMIEKARSRPLSYAQRINYGAPSADTVISYLENGLGDRYDRVWQPDTTKTPAISTTQSILTDMFDHPPIKVMQTCYQSDDAFNLTFSLPARNSYHFGIYYTEISINVTAAGQRVFNVEITNDTALFGSASIDLFKLGNGLRYDAYMTYSVKPVYLLDDGILNFVFTKVTGSIYGPIVCGLEILEVSDHDMPLGTDDDDVATLKNVTSPFASNFITWRGDPCLPYAYNWLTCTNDTRPFISTISLSNKSLAGEIPTGFNNFKRLTQLSLADNQFSGLIPDLSALSYLQVLDLHGNSLNGTIPDYLGSLSSLTTLNLDNNNFSGEVPASLLAQGSKIKFSAAGNSFLCTENSNLAYCTPSSSPATTEKKKGGGVAVAGAAAGGAIAALIAIVILIFCISKNKKKTVIAKPDPSSKNSTTPSLDDHSESVLPAANTLRRTNQSYEFTFEAIKTMTRNFERIIGRGGFGPVYYGVLNNKKEVAVKLLAKDSRQGEQQFVNEVELLTRVHHKNLVSLVGFCVENELVLVYKFMANGSLYEALHGKGAKLATWRDRLAVAVDASEGLDYLHQGCSPTIIHRDVKSSNILLSDQFEGKISDFGISKAKQYSNTTMTEPSQTFTAVIGSFGYLDPVYAETNTVNHSIDVYAFGVILFELVTGRPPLIQLSTRDEPQHISQWARPQIERGNLSGVVDPKLNEDFNVSSMWKVIDVAVMCVEHDRMRRPTMSEIMLALRSALSMEIQNSFDDTNYLDPQTNPYTTGVRAR